MQNGGLSIKKIKLCKKCNKERYANLSFCFQHYRQMAKEKRLLSLKRKLERKERSKKFQHNEWKKWHKKAWGVFSEHIRRRGANFQGLVECYTCYRMYRWQETNASHFHHGKADFYERNIKVCCVGCNLYKSGNLASYATRLVQEIGQEGMVELERVANTKLYTLEELKEIHEKYTNLLNNL